MYHAVGSMGAGVVSVLSVAVATTRHPRCNRTALSGILLPRLYHFACKELPKLCLYCTHQCCSLLERQCVQRLMQKNDLVRRRFVYDSIKRKTTGIIACDMNGQELAKRPSSLVLLSILVIRKVAVQLF
jgi:hypothetical protein